MKKIFLGFSILLVLFSSTLVARETFVNYGSTIAVKDLAATSEYIYAATDGGLIRLDLSSKTVNLIRDPRRIYDIHLRALVADSAGVLWIGSSLGYLTRFSDDGSTLVYNGYVFSEWDITRLAMYGKYVLVGSSKGLSVFNSATGTIVKNAVRFGPFIKPNVQSITVHKDTLYIGLPEGVASKYIGNGQLAQLNFYDRSIWNTLPADSVFSILNFQDTIVPKSVPAAQWNSTVVEADSNILKKYIRGSTDTARITLPGSISQIFFTDSSQCWIGTTDNYFYSWDLGIDTVHYVVSGLTFSGISRVHVAQDKRIWLMSTISAQNPWWQGIGWVHDDTMFHVANNPVWDLASTYFRGFCESTNGDLWFGTWGMGIKHLSKVTGIWDYYGIESGTVVRRTNDHSAGYSTAIAQDSLGYIWFGEGPEFDYGSIFCFNPEKTTLGANDYKGFFGKSASEYIANPWALNVDQKNRIFAGGKDGEVRVFRYDTNPITASGLTSYTFTGSKTEATTVHRYASAPDTTTYMASDGGLFAFKFSGTNSVELKQIGKEKTPVTCIVCETASKLWVGTPSGLMQIQFGKNDTTFKIFTQADGLASNNVTDLSFDRSAGTLWIATENGLSSLEIASGPISLSDNSRITVFPNPYSFSRHGDRTIFFQKVLPGTKIFIYNFSGALVARLSATITRDNEWRFSWTPSRKLAPGTYFYSAQAASQSNKKSALGKIMLVP